MVAEKLRCLAVLLWNQIMPLRFLLVGGWNFVFGYAVFAAL